MPQLNTFSNKSGETPRFVEQFAICLSLAIQLTETISFISVISRNIDISTLNFFSSTERMEERESCNCELLVKPAIDQWVLISWLYDKSSDIKFDNQHGASAASTKAKVSATIVLLTTRRNFFNCHIIRNKFP